MKTTLWLRASMSVLLVFSPTICFAAPASVCSEDVQRFCWNVDHEKSLILQCLYDHYQEISDGCYAALKKYSPPVQEPSAAPVWNFDNAAPKNGPPPADKQ